MPIIWPTIDLTSKTTQQGILSLVAGGCTAAGGALLPLLTAHPTWTWLPVTCFSLTAITGVAKWGLSLYQGDAPLPKATAGSTDAPPPNPTPPADQVPIK
jgi:hypothetical protein